MASLAWGSSARGTGKRAHDARDAHVKAGDGGAGAGGGSSGQRAKFAARKACTACLHGLPHLTGGCCAGNQRIPCVGRTPGRIRTGGEGERRRGLSSS